MKQHYHFKKEDLKNAILPLSGIIRESLEFVNRTVLVSSCFGYIELRVNSNGFYYYSKVPLINRENVINQNYVIDYKQLVNIMNYSGEEINIIKDNNKLFVDILHGRDEIDYFNFPDSYYYEIDKEEPQKYKNIQRKEFETLLSHASSLLDLGLKISDKRIYFNGKDGFSNFNSIMVMFVDSKLTGSMRQVDLLSLKKLVKEELQWNKLKSRMYFKSSIFKFSYGIVKITDLKSVEKHFKNFSKKLSFVVSPKQIFDILNYTNNTIGSTGYIKFYVDGEGLKIKSEKRTGTIQDFLISSKNYQDSVIINLKNKNLLKVFKVFLKQPEVEISFDNDKKMLVEGEKIKVILGSEFEF